MTASDMPLDWVGSGGVLSLRTDATARGADRPHVAYRDSRSSPAPRGSDPGLKAGIICNAKARHNISRDVQFLKGPRAAMPRDHAEMQAVLANFAARDVDVLVIDGGDGTVRDVISAAPRHFGDRMPRLAVVPSGKTNALAGDLGIPRDWSVQAALNAVRSGRIEQRAPIEILLGGASEPQLRGFIFGSGAFVRATALAQKTHRAGAFNSFAVGLSIAGGIAQTVFGPRDNVWRRGELLRLESEHEIVEGPHYLTLATTLRRLPTGIRPFGRIRDGLKVLRVDAPPKRILLNLPGLLGGSEAARLERDGYHRIDTRRLRVAAQTGFILDGERFCDQELDLRLGTPLRFVVP